MKGDVNTEANREEGINIKDSIRTFIPSSEKHGGTAELSSSASLRRMGNFSTADMGMSPR